MLDATRELEEHMMESRGGNTHFFFILERESVIFYVAALWPPSPRDNGYPKNWGIDVSIFVLLCVCMCLSYLFFTSLPALISFNIFSFSQQIGGGNKILYESVFP